MTDTTAFLNLCVTSAQQFNKTLEDLKSISDRIAADSSLSTNTAAAAQNTGRKELVAADFDNLKACIDSITAALNAAGTGSVTFSANVATIKLGFYKMI